MYLGLTVSSSAIIVCVWSMVVKPWQQYDDDVDDYYFYYYCGRN